MRRNASTDPNARPHGRPDVLYYFTPNLRTNGQIQDYKSQFDDADMEIAIQETCYMGAINSYYCSNEFQELALTIMAENNLTFSQFASDGKELFFRMINLMDNI